MIAQVKVNITDNKTVTWWADVIEGKDTFTFVKVTKEGDRSTVLPENKGDRVEYLIASKSDVVWIRPAIMNMKYGELELQKEEE